MRSIVVLGSLFLLQCGPQPAADGATESDASGTGSTSVGGATDAADDAGSATGTGDDGPASLSGGPDTGPGDPPDDPSDTAVDTGLDTETGGAVGPPACPGARWLATVPVAGDPSAAAVDSRGHVLTLDLAADSWDVREFDATGVLVNTVAVGDSAAQLAWGGVDAADSWYVGLRQGAGLPTRVVRKFAVGGVMAWERDLGPAANEEAFLPALAVAPDGATVVTEWWFDDDDHTRLVKHDAAGVLVWDKPGPPLLQVLDMNVQGAMAAVRFNDFGGEVRGLGSDAATLWTQDRWILDAHWAAIDPAGGVLLGAPTVQLHIGATRYAPDGTILWDHEVTPTGSTNDSFDDFAVNAAGEMAISSRADEWGVVYVAKLDAAGELVAVHPCTPSFSGTRVAIDDAGAVYLIGGGFDGSSSVQFVAAFD